MFSSKSTLLYTRPGNLAIVSRILYSLGVNNTTWPFTLTSFFNWSISSSPPLNESDFNKDDLLTLLNRAFTRITTSRGLKGLTI